MIGAIIGDIVGSRFEWNNTKSKEFEIYHFRSCFTDDSVMTLAIAQALLDCMGTAEGLSEAVVARMQEFGRRYPYAGYGRRFREWLEASEPQPYMSYGNGAAMRVSPCAYAAKTLEEAKQLSAIVTSVTHNHPEGIKGAEAVTAAVFMALHGSSKGEIRKTIREQYYALDFELEEIRESYGFDVTCQGSVPQAIEAFLEGSDYEDVIRNAVSIGGDSDTIAAIAGSIAEAYYGVPNDLRSGMHGYLDSFQLSVINSFERVYGIMTEHTRVDAPIATVRFVPAEVLSGNAREQIERTVSIFEEVLGLEELPELPVPKRRSSGIRRKKNEDTEPVKGMAKSGKTVTENTGMDNQHPNEKKDLRGAKATKAPGAETAKKAGKSKSTKTNATKTAEGTRTKLRNVSDTREERMMELPDLFSVADSEGV